MVKLTIYSGLISAALLLVIGQADGAIDKSIETDGTDKQQVDEAHSRCSRQSVILARQMLASELDAINLYKSIGFYDSDRDELFDLQRESLARVIMSGSTDQLLNEGKSILDIEASYFRPASLRPIPMVPSSSRSIQEMFSNHYRGAGSVPHQPFTLRLMRRHNDKCFLHKNKFVFVFGLSLGPFEHNLDVVYNMPKELQLTQPIAWKYAQVKMLIPRMNYEISIRQAANYKLNQAECPLEVADVTYLGTGLQQGGNKPQHIMLLGSGLAENNQTNKQLEQMFTDYTRPTISNRLRQVLRFSLNSKTLPLSSN